MTFVLAASTPKNAWLLVDRRLSWPWRAPIDTATKLINLDATDGNVLVGYAGLGITAAGTEVSEWMGRTLRGVNLPLEQSLNVLTEAARQRLPKHFARHTGRYHIFIAVGFRNKEPRIYTIEITDMKAELTWRTFTPYKKFGQSGPFFAAAGSGATAIPREQVRSRNLIRILKAHDRGAVESSVVAQELARLNLAVSIADKQVSKRCIVAWRKKDGGGKHWCFAGRDPDEVNHGFPTISRGDDLRALVQVTMKYVLPQMRALRKGGPLAEIDGAAIDADLAKQPTKPDDSLN